MHLFKTKQGGVIVQHVIVSDNNEVDVVEENNVSFLKNMMLNISMLQVIWCVIIAIYLKF